MKTIVEGEVFSVLRGGTKAEPMSAGRVYRRSSARIATRGVRRLFWLPAHELLSAASP